MKNKRYEYKYVLDRLSKAQVEQIILLHPASFSEIHHPRWINNIYYDTEQLLSYHENANGINRRTKYRLRWYGTNNKIIQNAVLEVKNKDNVLGWKEYIQLEPKEIDRLNQCKFLPNRDLPNLIPVVQNAYSRKYFMSADGKFRITIDTNIGHKTPLSNQAFIIEDKIVVELKFDKKDEHFAQVIFDFIPFRQRKNSKFAAGIEILLS